MFKSFIILSIVLLVLIINTPLYVYYTFFILALNIMYVLDYKGLFEINWLKVIFHVKELKHKEVG